MGEMKPASADLQKVRVGHFPNITHAQALIGRATGRFEKAFDKRVEIEWKTFNAGPAAIEALFAGAIDILYVGPNPVLSGFVRSNGEALRVITGVASGGSAFVVRPDAGIEKFEDIRGKRVASPQIGNSQDVALRYLMKQKGLAPRSLGGDVDVLQLSGGDQLIAFSKKQVDAIWTVEPMVSRLVSEAGGEVLFDEKELWPNGEYPTAILVARRKFLEEHPDWVRRWLKVHIEITDWIGEHPDQAKKLVNEELKELTGELLPETYLDESFKRIRFTSDPMQSEVYESARRAFEIRFLGKEKVNLDRLYDLSFLDSVKGKERA